VEEIHLPRWWNTDAFAGNIRSSSVRYMGMRNSTTAK
jgi:hypothetical protein